MSHRDIPCYRPIETSYNRQEMVFDEVGRGLDKQLYFCYLPPPVVDGNLTSLALLINTEGALRLIECVDIALVYNR